MNGAAALLVLRLLLPICDAGPEPDVRAEVYVVCPSCPQRTWVVVMSGWCYRDTAPEFTDRCGHTHWHDTSRMGATYRCTACCATWEVEESPGDPCWCGFDPEDREPASDVCPDVVP